MVADPVPRRPRVPLHGRQRLRPDRVVRAHVGRPEGPPGGCRGPHQLARGAARLGRRARRRRQHRRRRGGDHPRRTGRSVLDVGDRPRRHVHQPRRVLARPALQAHRRRGHLSRRPGAIHHPRSRRAFPLARGDLRGLPDRGLRARLQRLPGQYRRRRDAGELRRRPAVDRHRLRHPDRVHRLRRHQADRQGRRRHRADHGDRLHRPRAARRRTQPRRGAADALDHRDQRLRLQRGGRGRHRRGDHQRRPAGPLLERGGPRLGAERRRGGLRRAPGQPGHRPTSVGVHRHDPHLLGDRVHDPAQPASTCRAPSSTAWC